MHESYCWVISYSVGSVQHTLSEGSMAQHKQFFGENIPKNSGNSNSQLPPRHQLSGNRLIFHNYYYISENCYWHGTVMAVGPDNTDRDSFHFHIV